MRSRSTNQLCVQSHERHRRRPSCGQSACGCRRPACVHRCDLGAQHARSGPWFGWWVDVPSALTALSVYGYGRMGVCVYGYGRMGVWAYVCVGVCVYGYGRYTHTLVYPYTHTPIHPYTHTLVYPCTHTPIYSSPLNHPPHPASSAA